MLTPEQIATLAVGDTLRVTHAKTSYVAPIAAIGSTFAPNSIGLQVGAGIKSWYDLRDPRLELVSKQAFSKVC